MVRIHLGPHVISGAGTRLRGQRLRVTHHAHIGQSPLSELSLTKVHESVACIETNSALDAGDGPEEYWSFSRPLQIFVHESALNAAADEPRQIRTWAPASLHRPGGRRGIRRPGPSSERYGRSFVPAEGRRPRWPAPPGGTLQGHHPPTFFRIQSASIPAAAFGYVSGQAVRCTRLGSAASRHTSRSAGCAYPWSTARSSEDLRWLPQSGGKEAGMPSHVRSVSSYQFMLVLFSMRNSLKRITAGRLGVKACRWPSAGAVFGTKGVAG